MNDDMIERVARAIHKSDYASGGIWEEEGVERQQDYLDNARAAIAAMRDPTQAMRLAGRHYPEVRNEWGVWRAMIDAALAGEAAKTAEPKNRSQDS